MRNVLALSLSLALCALAGAADILSQKSTVAPSVTRDATTAVTPPATPVVDNWPKHFATGPTPLWIWGATPAKNYSLRTEFAAPANVKAARLKVSGDNHVILYLNGKQVAASDDWQEPAEADVSKLIREKNEIVAVARNSGGTAGLVFKLVMIDAKGAVKSVVSDTTWIASEKRGEKGVASRKVATYGDGPWGKVFDGAALAQGNSKVPANTFVVLPGFQVEKLFTVPKGELGSWVCLASDDKGRLIASDQDRKGLVRITPGKVGTDEETKVERIPAKITAAQGLLWHKGTLYVVCNGGPGSGLYRVTSSKNDDTLDKVEKLNSLAGGGEHGPHAVRLAPDGKSLYVICGNHTRTPDGFVHSRLPKNWAEDHLLPRQWDANGHARGILAPGGYVAKTDFDGKNWELVTSGYRNPYDFAFNADGEMFVYDADMEWDMGMPWYRPTRVSHATSGSEFGWRSGTGKWPDYYVDSLPAIVNIGPGSPVGVEFGYGAKFPARYQKALYVCDWTFGTMYAIHMEASGATYKATKEEFLSRTPLPLTDVVINKADGAMYFTVGGRGTQSELFRVTYVGKESAAPVDTATTTPDRKLLKQIEAYHRRASEPAKAVEFLLPLLGHKDRVIRYAARIALEHQPLNDWQEKALDLTDTDAIIGSVVGLARQGDKSIRSTLLGQLRGLTRSFDKLTERQQLDLLRAYQIVYTRMGDVPRKDTTDVLVKYLGPLFPQKSDFVNRELAQLLVYLNDPAIVTKVCTELQKPSKPLSPAGMEDLLLRNRGYGGTIANLLKNSADQQKLSYLFILRNARGGWNLDRWKTYYGFLAEARSKSGGASFQGFLNNIEKEAFANATDADRLAIEAAKLRPAFKVKELPKPIGPGRAWTTADLTALEGKLKRRNFKAGQRAYAAARCVVCHRFGGDGGATGPDLSQVAGRFSLKDLGESIVEPSKVISDQYKASVIRTADQKTVTGKIVSEVNGTYTVVTDPEDSTKVLELKKEDVEGIRPSNISLMPEKLLNDLNENEVLDLLAYLLSRGDPGHPMFK